MKVSGIVRRVDHLGRVVIPISLRRTLNINQGDCLKVFVDEDSCITFMKYSPFVGHSDLVQGYCDFLYNFSGIPVLMADKERIIAVSGVPREKYITRAISGEVKDLVGENRVFAGNKHVLAEEEGHFSENVVAPIVIADEIAGFVILCANANLGKEEQKLALTAAEFMGRYLSRDL